MTSPITFKQAETQANAILRANPAKLVWSKLPISTFPPDIQALAIEAIQAEVAARNAKAVLQAALDDKVDAPLGKRLVVTLGRDVGEHTDSVLYAWAAASSSSTRVVSFDQFIKG